jgi:hypothetical protein
MEGSAQLQTPIAVMGSTKQEPDITKWSMNPKELFTQLGHDIRGEVSSRGPHGEQWTKPEDAEPMLNETGITWLFAVLRPVADKYAMQANISREEAYHIGQTTCQKILEDLYLHQRKFCMKTIYYNTIMNMVINIVHFAVTRPIDGKERQAMHESSEVHRYYTNPEMQQQQKGGFHIPIIGSLFNQ